MTEMTREMTLGLGEVVVVGDGEEAEAVHAVAAGSGITREVNILVDTGTTITRMIITEIGVQHVQCFDI